MKKLLVPVLLLCLAHSAWAQMPEKKNNDMKPYFRVGVGYALSTNGATRAPINISSTRQLLPANGSVTLNTGSASNFSESFDLKRSSYGAGVHGTAAFGVMVSKHLGVELAAGVGMSTQKIKTNLSQSDSGKNNMIVLNVTQQAKLPVFIIPSIVLQTGGKINVYSRGGVVIPIQSNITQEGSYKHDRFNLATNSYIQMNSVTWSEEYKMRLTPGFSGALGVKYGVGKGISVWGEVGILSMSLYYKSSELTGYERDYLDLNGNMAHISLKDFTPSQRISKFEFKGTTTNNSNTYPTTQIPFSNFNISAGVMIDLL